MNNITVPEGFYCYSRQEVPGALIKPSPQGEMLAEIFGGIAESRTPTKKLICPYWSVENIDGQMTAFCAKFNKPDVPGKSLLFDYIKLDMCI